MAGEVALRANPDYDIGDAGVRSQFGEGDVIEQVSITTFDRWASQTGLDRLDIVKIDVEGAEPLVLEGMHGSLEKLRPRALIVEVKGYALERARLTTETRLRQRLRDHGYESTGQDLDRNELFRPAN